jgi:hypothetical protein
MALMKRVRNRALHNLFPLILIALALALYWPALRVFFSLDDFRFLLRAAGLEEYPESYRRILSTRLYFISAWKLFGTTSWPYHLVVLLLHAVNAWLVYLLSLRLRLEQHAASAASILFIAAPAAFLPMHWISGIQEVTVTFFALISAYAFLGRGTLSIVISLLSAALALLCKETSFLFLPALAVILPASKRRRWMLGMGGLLLGIGILLAVGAFAPRPAGDPYESAFGSNILWNLLTYCAWSFRFWDYFPDKNAVYQTGLAAWGLLLPLSLALMAWRYQRARRPILRASILFLSLLLPVLPLIRHSYLYYLYLPLIPLWLLAGSGIGKISRRSIQYAILAFFILNSIMMGIRHRGAELKKGIPEDPVLRYAASADDFIGALRETGMTEEDNHLFLLYLSGESIDVAGGRELKAHEKRTQFWVVEKALLEGKALTLFFPEMDLARFEATSNDEYFTGWQHMHIYWVSGPGEVTHLGFGENGRFRLIESAMANGKFDVALREVSIMLELRPDSPPLNYIRAHIALEKGDEAKLERIIAKLESMAAREPAPGEANRALEALHRLIAQYQME